MNARLLRARPQSGDYEELYFYAQSDTLCVLFETEDYEEYCGIFGVGCMDYSKVVFDKDIAFIIACGQGYIFDINKRKILHLTQNDTLQDVVITGFNGYFITCDDLSLSLYDTDLVWQSQRVSYDGIELDEVKEGVLYGKVWDLYEWHPFTLDLSSFRYKCKWICKEC
ncbi:MAG: hypothetical protein WCX65_05365 [bacterium]